MEINQNNFKQEILNSNKPSLVDFYAEWCQPCKAISPSINLLKEEFNGKANVIKIDVDSNPELAKNITSEVYLHSSFLKTETLLIQ